MYPKITASIAAVLLGLALWLGGCGQAPSEPEMLTGKVMTLREVCSQVPAQCGSPDYAVLNEAWVLWYYQQFRAELAKGQFGIMKWDEKFDCDGFASKMAADARVDFFRRSFHSFLPAKAPAMGFIWLLRPSGWHAMVIVWTDRGLRLLEPQNGQMEAFDPQGQVIRLIVI